jgi:hypothetical protein
MVRPSRKLSSWKLISVELINTMERFVWKLLIIEKMALQTVA